MTVAAQALAFDDGRFWVTLRDGRILGVPLAWFPRLLNATPTQRTAYHISHSGRGIHWDAINEDISVAGLLAGRGDQTHHSGN